MREHFHVSLTLMTDQLVEMNQLVLQAVDAANAALWQADGTMAESVISGDDRIDAFNAALEEKAIDLLARENPVARDLRTVVTGLQMSTTLERVGDLARHVAEVARMRLPENAVPEVARETITQMGQLAAQLVAGAGRAVAEKDLDQVAQLNALDRELDALHLRVFGIVREQIRDGEAAADVTLLSRYYERIGDHAVSVGRRIEYLVTGERMRADRLEAEVDEGRTRVTVARENI